MAGVGYVVSSKYRLVRLLGDGGMGSVYEAVHEVLGSRVAIKLLHPELAGRSGLIDRFLQEARVAAQIHSPHVVQVTDVDRTPDGLAYIVMELLQGEPLSSVLEREHRIAIPKACDYTRQILEALEAAHALGVTHRDLKPENVFVTFVAGKPLLRLIDFGIAKLRTSEPGAAKNLTIAGVVMGTAEYMAPEQAYSADRADARSDLFAVGVMLYEMIAGVRPTEGEADARIIAARVERGEVKPLVHAAPEVPRELAGLVHRAMAARPELRFASATEMRMALEKISLAPDGPRQPTKPLSAQVCPGTVLGAPADAVFSSAAGPSISGATVLGATPDLRGMSPPPPHIVVPLPAQAMSTPARHDHVPARRKRSSGAMWLWLILPLLLGVGAVVAYIAVEWHDDSEPTPVAPVRTSPPAGSAVSSVSPSTLPVEPVATTVPPANTVAPLTGATPPPVQRPPGATPTAKPSPAPSASGSGGAVPFPSVPFPPITLPSSFPTTLPSGFPTAFPSGFPSTLPPFPQLPGTPAPKAS